MWTLTSHNTWLQQRPPPLSSSLYLMNPATHVQESAGLHMKRLFKTLFIFIQSIQKLWGDPQISKQKGAAIRRACWRWDFGVMKSQLPLWILLICLDVRGKDSSHFLADVCLFLFVFSDGVQLLCWLTFHLKWQGTFLHGDEYHDSHGNTDKEKKKSF